MPDNNQSLNCPFGLQQAQAAQNQLNSAWTPITVRLDDATISRIADAVIAKLRNAGFIEPANA